MLGVKSISQRIYSHLEKPLKSRGVTDSTTVLNFILNEAVTATCLAAKLPFMQAPGLVTLLLAGAISIR